MLPVGGAGSLLNNDRYRGQPLAADSVRVQLGPDAPAGLALSANGDLRVLPRTPAGSYQLTYSVCLVSAPTDCGTGAATVRVEVANVSFLPDGVQADQAAVEASWWWKPKLPPTVITERRGIESLDAVGAYTLSNTTLDSLFSDVYPMSAASADAINAVKFWRERLRLLREEHPDWDPPTLLAARNALAARIAEYERDIAQQFAQSADAFWGTMTAPPDVGLDVSALMPSVNATIDGLLARIRAAETPGPTGIIERAPDELYSRLALLCADRARIDGSAQRGVIAAGLVNGLVNLLERGDVQFTYEDRSLVEVIGGMVGDAAMKVAEESARLYSDWQKQQPGSGLSGFSHAPDFRLQALAAVGLGPAGSGTYAALALTGNSDFFGYRDKPLPGVPEMARELGARLFPHSSGAGAPAAAQEGVTRWNDVPDLRPADRRGSGGDGNLADPRLEWLAGINAAQTRRLQRERSSTGPVGALPQLGAQIGADFRYAIGRRQLGSALAQASLQNAMAPGSPLSDVLAVAQPLGFGWQPQQALEAVRDKVKAQWRTDFHQPELMAERLRQLTQTEEGRAQLVAIVTANLASRRVNPGLMRETNLLAD